jgi:hypothetical protein
MINPENIKWGRIEPKDRSHEIKYHFGLFAPFTAKTVEKKLNYTSVMRKWYNQGNEGSCGPTSCEEQMSIYNAGQFYDMHKFYKFIQTNDDDPNTDPNEDTGTTLNGCFSILKKYGCIKPNETSPDINDGLLSFYWGHSADDARTAISLGRPVVSGIPWYSEFMTPTLRNGEYWIGTHKNWGNVLGGHAIMWFWASDQRQAILTPNSWGTQYPYVWLSYSNFNKLLSQGGEMAVGIDNPKIT